MGKPRPSRPAPADPVLPSEAAPGAPVSRRARPLGPWLGALAGILATLAVGFYIRAAENAVVNAEVDRRMQAITGIVSRTLRSHEEILYATRDIFDYSDEVSQAEFDGLAGNLRARHQGIQALEWVPRVPGPERAAFEAATRAAGFPDFEFRAREGTQFQRAPDLPEHYPIVFIHPFGSNRAAHGFDLASSRIWPQLAEAARDNQLRASGLVALITDRSRDQDWGYILYLPVYTPPVPSDPDARAARLRGFLVGVFRPHDIIGEAMAAIGPLGLDLLALDGAAGPDRRILHFHPAGFRPSHPSPPTLAEFQADPHVRSALVHLGDKQWELLLRPAPEWLASQRRSAAGFVLTLGLLSSALLGLYLNDTQRRTRLVAGQVLERTRELQEARLLLQEDIARRHDVEQRLRQSEARLQAILDQSPNAIFVKDPAGRYLLCNRTFASLHGLSADTVIGRNDEELFPPELARVLAEHDRAAHTASRPVEFEESSRCGLRTALVNRFALLDPTGRPYGLCGIATEITDRKVAEQRRLELERQLLDARRMESLGVLAGGIAHDFNNLLTAVLGNASLAREAAGSDPIRAHLQQIEQAARRAADLCQQMLAYAGKGRLVVAPVDLGEIVRGTVALLEVSISKNILLDVRLAPELPAVEADATQLSQVVMNLVINAADAIGAHPGRITVTSAARAASPDEFARAVGRPDLPAGKYLQLEVGDTGCGMDPATIERIFEPFFTTKFSGRGLGLSAVLGIIQSHHGALFVDSTPGTGTRFRLLLPAAGPPPAPGDSSRPSPTNRLPPLQGRILVVDDEPAVRDLARAALEIHGATILTATNGEEAVAAAREHGPTLALILLDLTMPGLSGDETVRRLGELPHRLPIILMSGYSESDATQRIGHLGVAGFLQKPFELDVLLHKVRSHLP